MKRKGIKEITMKMSKMFSAVCIFAMMICAGCGGASSSSAAVSTESALSESSAETVTETSAETIAETDAAQTDTTQTSETADTEQLQTDDLADEEETGAVTNDLKAESGDCTLDLMDHDTSTSNGQEVFSVYGMFTNNGEANADAFTVKAYQNGKELESIEDEDTASLLAAASDGVSTEVTFSFVLNDKSDVEVRIYGSASDKEALATATYSLSE